MIKCGYDDYYDDNQFDPVYRMVEKRCKEIISEFRSVN